MMNVRISIKHTLEIFFIRRNVSSIYNFILEKYSEPWRKYHTLDHLSNLFNLVEQLQGIDQNNKNILKLSIVYHDLVHFSWSHTNEIDSANLLKEHWNQYGKNPDDWDTLKKAYKVIHQTKDHSGMDELSVLFNQMDMSILDSDTSGLVEWEKGIYHEYSFAPTEHYKTGRLEFLNKYVSEKPKLGFLIDQLSNFKPCVGYYAGSFDPFHLGHLSIVRQAQKLFDKVVIVIAQNPAKPAALDNDKKVSNIFDILGGVEVVVLPPDQFLPELLMERSQHEEVFLVRGIRNSTDWSTEDNQIQYMKTIWSDLQTVYLSCPRDLEHVSSSGIRAMNKIKAGSGDVYLPNKHKLNLSIKL
jgi:pantetheine-phosphate adenylyltransferase